jgi:glucose-1-phosphate thymidylyltransferase
MKGIVLAGGKSTRLWPITLPFSKQLLPVYDKPMIYYPLSTLMLAGIQEILIICTLQDEYLFKRLLGDGSQFGLHFTYQVQLESRGIAEALIIGEDFIGDDPVVLTLGDNLIYGATLSQRLKDATIKTERRNAAVIFGYHVTNPTAYGVVELSSIGRPLSLQEKPITPKSDLAVPGLYFYPPGVSKIAFDLKPSARNELEITDLNQVYLNLDRLHVDVLGRGNAWFDMGTHESLLDAANFVEAVQRRQGLYIACPEEIAYANNWISKENLQTIADQHISSSYGYYLNQLAK